MNTHLRLTGEEVTEVADKDVTKEDQEKEKVLHVCNICFKDI